MRTFTSKQYLEIDIATNYGLDKASWDERLDWFKKNEAMITVAPIATVKGHFLPQAKDPALVLAGILAYRDMLAGEPTGYPIGLDATASGLQLLSVLINCPLSASICNVLDRGRCVDAYTAVYDACKAKGMINQQIDRKGCKSALMTHLYGSKAIPKEVFGEGQDLQTFYSVLDELLPGANQLNYALLSLWQPDALEHAWTLPDGFDVRIKVMGDQVDTFEFLGMTMETRRKVNMPKESSLSLGANIVHSLDGMVVREMVRRCSYTYEDANRSLQALMYCTTKRTDRQRDLDLLRQLELWNESGFLSVRIIELIDMGNSGHITAAQRTTIENLINTLPARPFDVLAIHDCFRCHPNYGNDLRKQYAEIIADISDSNLLSHIASQVTGKPMPANKMLSSLSAQIRQSNYMLC